MLVESFPIQGFSIDPLQLYNCLNADENSRVKKKRFLEIDFLQPHTQTIQSPLLLFQSNTQE